MKLVIKTLIVDDEILARRRIRRLLESEDDIQIVGECANGTEAVQALNKQPIDIIFLDVQMPELSGFEVLEEISSDKWPIIIFVTAYDKYALKAFDVHAIDYLLKPFDDERFYIALQHAREQFLNAQNSHLKQKLLNLLTEYNPNETIEVTSLQEEVISPALNRLMIKAAGRIYFVKTADICRIKAAGKYLQVLVGEKEYTIRQTMQDIESKLDSNRFLRIHRSTIINIDHVKEMQHWYKNEYIFIMHNGERLISSSSYRKKLERVFKKLS